MFIHARWDRARRICTISRQAPLRSCAPGGCSREGCAGRAAPRPQWCCAAPASGRDGAPSDRGARAAGVARRHARSRPRDRRPRPRNAAARQSSWRCPRRRTRRRRRQRPPASRSRGRRRRRWRWPRARLAARRSTRSSRPSRRRWRRVSACALHFALWFKFVLSRGWPTHVVQLSRPSAMRCWPAPCTPAVELWVLSMRDPPQDPSAQAAPCAACTACSDRRRWARAPRRPSGGPRRRAAPRRRPRR